MRLMITTSVPEMVEKHGPTGILGAHFHIPSAGRRDREEVIAREGGDVSTAKDIVRPNGAL